MPSRSREDIEKKFNVSGEKEHMKQLLIDKLRTAGWAYQVKSMAKNYINEKGIDKVTLEDMYNDLKQPARRAVPDEVKRELLSLVREFVSKEVGIVDL